MKNIYLFLASLITFCSYGQVCTTVTNNTSTAVTSTSPGILTITITEDVTITDLNMCLDLTHPYLSDLGIVLTSPANTVVSIINPSQCNGAHIDATFDDDGSPLSCDVTISGVTQATEALSAFNGESALGDWTLTVVDTLPLDDGLINSFCIEYCGNILSTSEYEDQSPFRIFPNPAKDKLSLSSEESLKVTLFDIYGRKVVTMHTGPNAMDLDISKVSSGNYIVEIITAANKRFIKKLIVE